MKTLLTILLITASTPVYADGFQEAAMYGIDRAICKIQVPQSRIDEKLIQGMIEKNVETYTEATNIAAWWLVKGVAILDQNKTANEYCAKRRVEYGLQN